MLIGDPANNVDPSRNKPPLKNPQNQAIPVHAPGLKKGKRRVVGYNPNPMRPVPSLFGGNPAPGGYSLFSNPRAAIPIMNPPYGGGGLFGGGGMAFNPVAPPMNLAPGSDLRYDSVTDGSAMYIVYSN